MNGLEFRELREKAGLTQEAAANLLRTSVKTISNYETSGKVPQGKQKYFKELLENYIENSSKKDISQNTDLTDEILENLSDESVVDYVLDNFDDLMQIKRFANLIENIELKAQVKALERAKG